MTCAMLVNIKTQTDRQHMTSLYEQLTPAQTLRAGIILALKAKGQSQRSPLLSDSQSQVRQITT